MHPRQACQSISWSSSKCKVVCRNERCCRVPQWVVRTCLQSKTDLPHPVALIFIAFSERYSLPITITGLNQFRNRLADESLEFDAVFGAFQLKLIELRREMEQQVNLLAEKEKDAKQAWLVYRAAA